MHRFVDQMVFCLVPGTEFATCYCNTERDLFHPILSRCYSGHSVELRQYITRPGAVAQYHSRKSRHNLQLGMGGR